MKISILPNCLPLLFLLPFKVHFLSSFYFHQLIFGINLFSYHIFLLLPLTLPLTLLHINLTYHCNTLHYLFSSFGPGKGCSSILKINTWLLHPFSYLCLPPVKSLLDSIPVFVWNYRAHSTWKMGGGRRRAQVWKHSHHSGQIRSILDWNKRVSFVKGHHRISRQGRRAFMTGIGVLRLHSNCSDHGVTKFALSSVTFVRNFWF